jgi:hypothetical protein
MTIPTETRPIRIDPEMAERLEAILEPLEGKARKAADAAVMSVYHSGVVGSFGELLERYSEAIAEAVAEA